MSQNSKLVIARNYIIATFLFTTIVAITISLDGLYSDFFFGTHFFIEKASKDVVVGVNTNEITETTITTITQNDKNESFVVNNEQKDSTESSLNTNSHQNIPRIFFIIGKFIFGFITGCFLFALNFLSLVLVKTICIMWSSFVRETIVKPKKT